MRAQVDRRETALGRGETRILVEGVTTDRDTGRVSRFRLIQNLRARGLPDGLNFVFIRRQP